jgi:hypothetical protein
MAELLLVLFIPFLKRKGVRWHVINGEFSWAAPLNLSDGGDNLTVVR